MNVQRATKRVAKSKAFAIIILIGYGCGGSKADDAVEFGPTSSTGRPFEGVAQAAPKKTSFDSDASVKDAAPVMPENPAHISLRLPKAPKILVRMMSGQAYPYPFSVSDDGNEQVVTMYLPQGVQMNVAVSSVDADGKPLAEPVQLSLEPEAKLGTAKFEFGSTAGIINFSGGAQNTLQLGETLVSGPITDEFIGGQMRSVMQGIYTPETDSVCEVKWTGCKEVYSFLDGPPVLRTESFLVSLKAGQKLGLYPVPAEGDVKFTLSPTSQE